MLPGDLKNGTDLDAAMRRHKRPISPERQSLCLFGTVLLAIGAIVIVVGFLGFVTASQASVTARGVVATTVVDGKVVFEPRPQSARSPVTMRA